MRKLAERYPALERPLYSPPKPVLASKLMSYANIGGMFFPFTMESNINVDNPFSTVPWTMAHELAHQCGFMREDEANFIAYLACKESDDALMRYSGLLLAYDNATAALRKADPEAATQISGRALRLRCNATWPSARSTRPSTKVRCRRPQTPPTMRTLRPTTNPTACGATAAWSTCCSPSRGRGRATSRASAPLHPAASSCVIRHCVMRQLGRQNWRD